MHRSLWQSFKMPYFCVQCLIYSANVDPSTTCILLETYIMIYYTNIFIILYFRCQMYLATKTGILSAAHPILLNPRAPRQAYPHPTTPITTIRIIRTIKTIKTIRTITNMSLLSTTIVILIQPANQ